MPLTAPQARAAPAPFAGRASGLAFVALVLSSAFVSPATAASGYPSDCGNPFKNHFGPFDYRSHRGEDLEIVEKYHYTAGIETMTKPVNTTMQTMAQDVGYTLHVFPNHHRALITMQRLGERYKTDFPPGASFSVECYFQRAVRYAPDDTVARGLFAQYLVKKNRKSDAIEQLEAAEKHAEDSAISHYNIGLNYFEMGQYDRAVTQAQLARSLGLERMQLIDMLKRANKWQDSPRQDSPRQDSPRQDSPRQDPASGDQPRQDQARQDQPPHEQAN